MKKKNNIFIEFANNWDPPKATTEQDKSRSISITQTLEKKKINKK